MLSESTENQFHVIKHACGFDSREPGFRSHYCDNLDSADMKVLIAKGFMIGPFQVGLVGEGHGMFHLTDKAKLELKKLKRAQL
jgi:hypothetical protein